jgi:capsular exopolysaccharide synthesis family protein
MKMAIQEHVKRVGPFHDPHAELSARFAEDYPGLGIKDIVGFLRRQAWIIAAPLLVALAAAIWYLLNSQPLYTATADLMLDTQRQQLLQQQPVPSEISLDAAVVGSQIELIRSEGLLRLVVENLHLTDDPQFVGQSTGIFNLIRQLFPADEEISKKELAVLRLSNGLQVQRVGQTYIIAITYEFSNPDTATRIANAVAEAYILDGLSSRKATAQRTLTWLRDRVTELREEAINANREVQDFKDALTRDLVSAKQAQAALRVLESSAQTYHTLHSSFLQRLVEREQQQSFPSSEARVITPAVRSEKKPPARTLIVASFLGLALGFGLAVGREVLMPTLRTPKQVEQAIGIECLGVLPTLKIGRKIKPQRANKAAVAARLVPKELGLLRNVILDPFSRFADTMRKLQNSADFASGSRHGKVIGIISAISAEGKTTVSANLAQLLAKGGRRTLLIDGDLHDRTLSYLMAPGAEAGIMQVITGRAHLGDLVWRDPLTGLEFLPAYPREAITDTGRVLSSEGMTRLIEVAKEAYEYVVIDFPRMASVIDAKAAAHVVDAFILVIQWDQTSPDVVREALSSAEMVRSKTVAAVLNRADSSAFGQF